MTLLKDKVAIITGGTRGIGLAAVETFLAHGAKVALCGSRKETVDKALETLKKSHPDAPVIGFSPSLTNPEEIKQVIDAVVSQWGKLDILVNNAGISHSQSIFDYTAEEFQDIMNINVQSAFNFSQAAARVMKESGGGSIINTSSVVSIYGQPSGCGYPTSKFALNGLTKSLARELAPYQIRVNGVLPGVTQTDMVDALPEQTQQYLLRTIPLGRLGTAQDIANAFLFLASDFAGYITGANLSVDGGIMI